MQLSRMVPGVLYLAVMLTLGFGPAPALAQTPTGCTELVQNGGFETTAVWQLGATAAPPQYITSNLHSGAWSLRMGIADGVNRQTFSSARQTMTIPASAPKATLYFWVNTLQSGAPDGDYVEAVLLSPDGATTLARLWREAGGNRPWSRLVYDLSVWRGQSFQLYFNVYNDGVGGIAQMVLDDVSLLVCSSDGGSCDTGESSCGLITPVLPTVVPITPTRGACPNPILPCKAPTATPGATAAASQSQAAPVIIAPQAAPVIMEPQSAPAIIEPQAVQDAQPAQGAQPAIIVVAPESEALQPSILDLSAAPAVVVPLPTGMVEPGAPGAADASEVGVLVAGEEAVEPSVTQIALVVTVLPASPQPVEPTIPAEIGNATPVPTRIATPAPVGRSSSIMARWPKYWWLIPLGFIAIFVLLWFFARRSRK